MSEDVLLPCPFCKNDNAEVCMSVVSSEGGQVVCRDCAAAGSWMANEAEAIAAWNDRTIAALPSADEVEMYREALEIIANDKIHVGSFYRMTVRAALGGRHE